jgi:Fic family protein
MFRHEKELWYHFEWDEAAVLPLLSCARNRQGLLLGRLSGMGFELQSLAELEMRSLDVLKSSEIEGEILDARAVRSSVARRLGLEIAEPKTSTHLIDGVVDMTMDATHGYLQPLTESRLCGWHAALFPTGYSGLHKISVAAYRQAEMEVVSGPIGREKVHYRAPAPERVPAEMETFIDWFNAEGNDDEVIKAAIAHLWFVSIHPFDDGNGRIARTLTDMLLARSDNSPRRFYSMSYQILMERKGYYNVLESTQKGIGPITTWLTWFLTCLNNALQASDSILDNVMRTARFWQRHADTSLNDRQRKALSKMLEGFDGKMTSKKWSHITKTSPDTALRDIRDLIDKGILVRDEARGRSAGYLLNEQ